MIRQVDNISKQKETRIDQRTMSALSCVTWRISTLYMMIVWVTILCGLAQPLLAATYFVSKSGSDENPGTEALPWLTIQQAANTVTAGDTVYVQPGTYNERVLCTAAIGTKENPIRFIANGTVTNYGWYFSKPYYVVKGFTLNGDTSINEFQGLVAIMQPAKGTAILDNTIQPNPNIDLSNRYGIWMEPGDYAVSPENCTIKGNRIIEPQAHALMVQGKSHLIENNYFTGTQGWDAIRALADATIYRGNLFENWSNLTENTNHPDLIQAFSENGEIARDVIVENNIGINCVKAQIGNMSDRGEEGRISRWTWRNNIFANVDYAMSMNAPDMHFYNNVFYRSGKNTGGPILFRTSVDNRGEGNNGKVINNIFVECGSDPTRTNQGWYIVDNGLTGVSADYNLVIGTGAGTVKTGFNEVHGLNGLDPLFVDPEQLDFRIKCGPAVGSGMNLSALFTEDAAGFSRSLTLPWDIGAYAYQGEPSALTTPTNTQILQ